MKQLSLSLAALLLLSPLNILAEEPVSTETPIEITIVENEPGETSSETGDLMNEVIQSGNTADDSQEANSIPEPTLESQTDSAILDENLLGTAEDEKTQEMPVLGCDAQEAVACVNEVGYTNLPAAIEAAPTNGNVDVLKDISLVDGLADDDRYFLNINKSVVINGNNHNITVKNRGIRILGGDTKDNEINVAFKNVTLTNSDSEGRVIDTRGGYFTVNIENSSVEATGMGNVQPITIGGNHSHLNTVNIVDSIISGANETINNNNAGYGFTIFNPVNLNIAHSTVNGYAALYFKGPNSSSGSNGSKVTIIDSEINSFNVHTLESGSSFGTIVLEEGNIDISLENTTVKAKTTNSATQSVISIPNIAADFPQSNVTFTNNSTIIVEGENAQVAEEGKKDYLTFESANSNANLRAFISDEQSSVGIKTNDGTKYYVDSKENINSIVSTQENIQKIEVVSGVTELNNIPSGVVIENSSNNDVGYATPID